MKDFKGIYKQLVSDCFPSTIKISIGGQTLIYQKRSWKVDGEKKGLRYGENPHQMSALYELINGNIILGDCHFISPGQGLVSALTEKTFTNLENTPVRLI